VRWISLKRAFGGRLIGAGFAGKILGRHWKELKDAQIIGYRMESSYVEIFMYNGLTL